MTYSFTKLFISMNFDLNYNFYVHCTVIICNQICLEAIIKNYFRQ